MFKLNLLRALVFSFLIPFAALPAHAQNLGGATVSGVVTDDTGAAIPGVTVTASRVGEQAGENFAVSDMKGAVRIGDLRPGAYAVQAVLEGFQPLSRNVTLVTGQVVEIAFKLVPAFSDTVEVVAEAERTGEVAILETRRQAPVVSDSISAEEIRKTPDSTAAGVVERLTGVTMLGNKYVFVRGLGERYSGATINGSTLPTTETEKRVVPLDLFPAKLLETVNVVKTYTPDKSGDFGSGVVEMTTTAFPRSATFKLTVGSGYRSSTTGSDFRRYAGGLGRLGEGGQSISSVIPKNPLKRTSGLDSSGYSPAELEVFGDAFVGDWTGTPGTAAPATDFSITYGDTFGSLGVVLSAVSNHSFDTIDEEQRFFGLDTGEVLVPRNDYDLTTDSERASAGFVGNVSYRLTDRNCIYFNSVLTRDATAEDRFQEGLNTNSGGEIRDYRNRYQKEQLFSSRLRGEHNLIGPGMGSLFDWSVAFSEASNDSDFRENLYRESAPGVFALQVGFPESGKIDYFGLSENIQQGGLSYSVFYTASEGRVSGSFKGGIDQMERTRDFAARRFRFETANQLAFDLELTPEEIFTPENIRPGGFEIREVTGTNDAYGASHTVSAAYLMSDATFGKLRVIGGARYEDSDQRVRTFNPFDLANEVESINVSRDVLPSLNLVYQFAPQTNFRFGYGRSVNRPEFRELSPFTFVEVTGGRSVAGNPDLVQATLDGLDLRWETFPAPGQVIAASLFYKKIAAPIERIIQPTTELRTSYVNAQSATLRGLELEFRRSLAGLAGSLQNWTVNVNYAYIKSEVTVGQQQLSVVTSLDRPLTGQSDQVGNLALQFYKPEWGSMVRALGSYSGKRLTDVGAFGLPDIYETGFTSVDLVVSQELGFVRGLELKLTATNLLDGSREFLQGNAVQRRYTPGRTAGISLSYTPF
ncbi:MAG TPA: TonB-dependent receptor [Thermoanaerobaculia bacterium]|nr:TonB-dependent receptor [Thermoanaerobaculia bacterium]